MATIVAGIAVAALGSYGLYKLASSYFRRRSSTSDRPTAIAAEDEAASLPEDRPNSRIDGKFVRPQDSTDSDDDFVMVEKSMLEAGSSRVSPKPAQSAPQEPQGISSLTTTTIETPVKRTTSAPPPQVVQSATPTSTMVVHDDDEAELFKTPQQRTPPTVAPKPTKRTPALSPPPAASATPTSQEDAPTKRFKPSPGAVQVMFPTGKGVALRHRRNEGTVATGDGDKDRKEEGEENKENRLRTFALNGLSPTRINQNGNLETPISFDEPIHEAELKVGPRIRGPQNRRPPTRR